MRTINDIPTTSTPGTCSEVHGKTAIATKEYDYISNVEKETEMYIH